MSRRGFNVDMNFIDGGSISAGFVLSGINPSYKDAKLGLVAEKLLECNHANPIFFIDEIDKFNKSENSNTFAPLHTLLTPDTSKYFKDEFAKINFDCSSCNWVATANESKSIPDSIVNRFIAFEIKNPTVKDMPAIIDSILEDIFEDPKFPWSSAFSKQIPDKIKTGLTSLPTRDVKMVVLSAFSKAAKEHMSKNKVRSFAKKIKLSEQHFNLKGSVKSRIGFLG